MQRVAGAAAYLPCGSYHDAEGSEFVLLYEEEMVENSGLSPTLTLRDCTH